MNPLFEGRRLEVTNSTLLKQSFARASLVLVIPAFVGFSFWKTFTDAMSVLSIRYLYGGDSRRSKCQPENLRPG